MFAWKSMSVSTLSSSISIILKSIPSTRKKEGKSSICNITKKRNSEEFTNVRTIQDQGTVKIVKKTF